MNQPNETACHRDRLYARNADERARIISGLTDELAHHGEVVFAFLYGSFADSETFHDVDVGVYLDGRSPEHASVSAVRLAQRLSDRIGLPTDVRVLNDAPISFLYHVLRGRLILNRDEDVLTEVMEATVHRYLDRAALLRHSTKEAFAA